MTLWTQTKKIGVLTTLSLLVSACGSSSDSPQAPTLFEAGTGKIANGTVAIESYDNNQWQPLDTLTTNDEGIYDPSSVAFNADTWYRLTTATGHVLDLDLNGETDAETTEFKGHYRSLAKGSWLNTLKGSHIGFYTETAYTHVLSELNKSTVDWNAVETQLEEMAPQLLLKDATGDDTITYLDILSAQPNDLSYTNIINQTHAQEMLTATSQGLSSIFVWMPYSEAPSLSTVSGTVYSQVISSDQTKLYATKLRSGLFVKDLVTGESNLYSSGHIYNSELAIDETNQLAYLPNGSSNGVHVIDLETGQQLDTIITDMRAFAIDVSSDGALIYLSNSSGLHIYNVETTAVTTIDMSSSQKIEVNDDGTAIDLAGNDFIAQYDLVNDAFTFNIELNDSAYEFELNDDQTLAYVANSGSGFSIVNLSTEAIQTFEAPDGEDVYSIVVKPNNTNHVRVISEGAFHTFDLDTLEYIDDAFTSQYPDLYLDSTSSTIYLEESDIYITGEDLLVFGAYSSPGFVSQTVDFTSAVYNVKLNHQKDQIAFTRYDGYLGIINQLNDTVEYVALRGRPNQITLSADGQKYYVAIADVGIDIIDADSFEVANMTHTALYSESDIHTASNLLYTLDYDTGDINVFDIDDNSYVKTIEASACATDAMTFDPAQEYLYLACNKTSTGIRRFKLDDETWESFDIYSSQSLTFSPDGATLYAGQNFQVQILDIASGEVTHTFDANHVIYGIEYWEEKNALLIGGNGGPSYIDIASGSTYELDTRYGNHFDLDKTTNTLYFGAGSSHGLQQIDLSDLGIE